MNLVIGNTSQLSYYFPNDYIKISSRNIDYKYIKNNNWNSIYITFAEQRIYNKNIDYITPNYNVILDIIQAVINQTNKIVCYGSCELWNNKSGCINSTTPIDFSPPDNQYCLSKLMLLNKIIELRQVDLIYNKVIFIHPFYFNSIHRSKYFLFGKIFSSILEKKQIEVGNLNFYRDIVHTKFIVEQSIKQNQDCVVGSGKLTNIRDFVRDLYSLNNMNFNDFVKENVLDVPTGQNKLIMAQTDLNYSYDDLLRDTQEDIINYQQNHI